MISWKNVYYNKPRIGERVLTYCPELNFPYNIMKYEGMPTFDEGDRSVVIGSDSFTGKDGFLTDDVSHWVRLEKPNMFIPIKSIDITDVNIVELEAPFTVWLYEEDDESYRVEFGSKPPLYGFGNSLDEALEMLKREIYTLKHDLNEQGDDILPQFMLMRDFLNDMIREDNPDNIIPK